MVKKIMVVAFLAFLLLPAVSSEAVLINYDGTGFNYPTQILGYYSGLDGSPVHSSGFMWLASAADLGRRKDRQYERSAGAQRW
jgi:hypothetical protein